MTLVISLLSLICVLSLVIVQKKQLEKSKSIYFYLKLKQLEIEYEHLKMRDEFSKYKNIEENILNTLHLIKGKNEINLRKIKLVKPKVMKIFSDEEINGVSCYLEECKQCDNQEIINLLENVLLVKEEIIKYRFPIRHRYYKFIFMVKLQILLVIAFILYSLMKILKININKSSNRISNQETMKKIKHNKEDFLPLDGDLRYAH